MAPHPPPSTLLYNGETGGGFLGIIDFLCWRGSRVEIWDFFSVPAASVLFIYLPSQSMGARICFKSCFYFYHSHLSFYGFNRPSMTSLPPSEVFAPTYFHQTSFLTKNKKFPSNKARPSISEFYSSVVTRWCREQAGGTHSSVSFPHFHVSSQSCWTEVQ